MKFSRIAIAAVTALALAGCTEGREKEELGTIIGGIGGAALGSQIGGGSGRIIAAAAGTLLGAFAGRELGKSLDKADVAAAQQAQNKAHAAPIGQQISWSNPESGHSGTVTPTRAGTDSIPTLLEVRTYRFMGHSMSDAIAGTYRTKAELEEYMKRDPIMVLRMRMQEAGEIDPSLTREDSLAVLRRRRPHAGRRIVNVYMHDLITP